MICMAVGGKKKGLLNRLLDTMSRGGKYPKGGGYMILLWYRKWRNIWRRNHILQRQNGKMSESGGRFCGA